MAVLACLLVWEIAFAQAKASHWQCGLEMNAATEKQQTEKKNEGTLQFGAQVRVLSVDEIVDVNATDQKLRLADIAFAPEYEADGLHTLKALSAVKVDIFKLSTRGDYLGRTPVKIIHSKADAGGVSGVVQSDWAEHLLAKGLALLLPESGQQISHLFEAENQAIENRLGLWADRTAKGSYFVVANDAHLGKTKAVRAPDVADAIGRFVVVEGMIKSIEHQEWRTYLNFGSDWRSDFTIALDDEIRQAFAGSEISQDHLGEWIGRRMRVRGVVENRGGPYIALINPDWLCSEMD